MSVAVILEASHPINTSDFATQLGCTFRGDEMELKIWCGASSGSVTNVQYIQSLGSPSMSCRGGGHSALRRLKSEHTTPSCNETSQMMVLRISLFS